MSRRQLIVEYGHTIELEMLSNPFFLKKKLEEKYSARDQREIGLLNQQKRGFQEKINYYYNLIKKNLPMRGWNPKQPSDIAKPLNEKSDFEDIAKKASIYFQQGLELYLTSMTMNQNSSPLIEYYSFLQCAKGSIQLNLDINNQMFTLHGIIDGRDENVNYIRPDIKSFGVFQSLLLISASSNEITDFITGKNNLSLEELLEFYIYPHEAIPAYGFIGSWMLSSLVRYKPEIWQKIYFGLESDVILKINKFRNDIIPNAIEQTLRLGTGYAFLRSGDPLEKNLLT